MPLGYNLTEELLVNLRGFVSAPFADEETKAQENSMSCP